MSTDYVYYLATPDSPAFNVVLDRITQQEDQRKWAKAFGDKHLTTTNYGLVSNDVHLLGFAPDSGTCWSVFRQHFNHSDWREKEDRSCRWIQPRAKSALSEEWSKAPKVMGVEDLSYALFGMRRFMKGLNMYSMYGKWDTKSKVFVVGIPWLASRGHMEDFGPGKLKLCKGLKKLPFDKAMEIIHHDVLNPKPEKPTKSADSENLFES